MKRRPKCGLDVMVRESPFPKALEQAQTYNHCMVLHDTEIVSLVTERVRKKKASRTSPRLKLFKNLVQQLFVLKERAIV